MEIKSVESFLDYYEKVRSRTLRVIKAIPPDKMNWSYREGKFTLAFVGYGDESEHSVLEFTHNWDVDHYDLGDGYGHIALGVDDIYGVCDRLREQGAKIVREPGPMKHGTTVIAFVEDPTGYKVELIERK